MNSFYTDDLTQRLIVLWVMALMVLYANAAKEVDTEISAIRTTAGAYLAARFTTMMAFLICSFASHQHRTQARILCLCMFVGMLIAIPLFFESVSIRAKIAVVVVMIVFQEATWALSLSPFVKRLLNLQYGTAVDIAHEIDRLAAFFIIILGEFVLVVILGDPAGVGLTPGYGKAVCTLTIAFCLNWIYVSGDGSLESTHPIRRSAWTAFGFFLLHLPLAMSFLIAGHVAALSVQFDQFESGQRWLLGGGLAVGLLCLWIYAMLFKDEDTQKLMMAKPARISMRLVVAIILVLLPLSEEKLNATQLMGIIVALFGFLVVWETVGGLLKGACFWEPWTDRHAPKEAVEPESTEQNGKNNNTISV